MSTFLPLRLRAHYLLQNGQRAHLTRRYVLAGTEIWEGTIDGARAGSGFFAWDSSGNSLVGSPDEQKGFCIVRRIERGKQPSRALFEFGQVA